MTETELREVIASIDDNIRELMADGKLAAAKYQAGDGGPMTDRASGLKALLEARSYYQQLLDALLAVPTEPDGPSKCETSDTDPAPGGWEVSRYVG